MVFDRQRVDEVVERRDLGRRDPLPAAEVDPERVRPRREHRRHVAVEAGAVLDPLGAAGVARIVVQIVAATGGEQGPVVATAVRQHADPAVERLARPALGRQDALVAGVGEGRDRDGARAVLDEHERAHDVDHRHLDPLPLTGPLTMEQRGGHGPGDGESADLVGHQRRQQHRIAAETREQVTQSARRLDDVVVSRVVGAGRVRREAGRLAVHEPRAGPRRHRRRRDAAGRARPDAGS